MQNDFITSINWQRDVYSNNGVYRNNQLRKFAKHRAIIIFTAKNFFSSRNSINALLGISRTQSNATILQMSNEKLIRVVSNRLVPGDDLIMLTTKGGEVAEQFFTSHKMNIVKYKSDITRMPPARIIQHELCVRYMCAETLCLEQATWFFSEIELKRSWKNNNHRAVDTLLFNEKDADGKYTALEVETSDKQRDEISKQYLLAFKEQLYNRVACYSHRKIYLKSMAQEQKQILSSWQVSEVEKQQFFSAFSFAYSRCNELRALFYPY